MDLLELRYFLTVADEGSFSRASIKLGITQPGLSRQIQRLEREFHTYLFYRNGRGVALTPAGEKLAETARAVVQQFDAAKGEILEEANRPQGIVVFGVPPSLGSSLAAPVALSFRRTHADATLRVREAFSSILLEWVESGRLDLAVLYDARRGHNQVVAPLLLEDLFLVQGASRAASAARASSAELAKLGFVLPGGDNGLRRVVDQATQRAGIELTVDMELDSVPALKQLVENGHWSTILPYGAVHAEVAAGRLSARPIAMKMQALLVTATPKHRPVSKATTALLRIVRAEIQRCVAAGVLRGTIA
ncbi:MAG: LysR family transcriptional regulator [Pseudomonadota bacterium]